MFGLEEGGLSGGEEQGGPYCKPTPLLSLRALLQHTSAALLPSFPICLKDRFLPFALFPLPFCDLFTDGDFLLATSESERC